MTNEENEDDNGWMVLLTLKGRGVFMAIYNINSMKLFLFYGYFHTFLRFDIQQLCALVT